ncbi:hypothetical protein ACFQV2_22165 [Actinokineospora soli]|uniref:Condensation domain-containing protein n=1 Tax=Actinokineospora soli TaxID=1048753 RepID=A0ABW2TRA8_9PSEU
MRPLTPAQRELWTAGDPADPALWTGSYLDITGPLDAAALCAAIDAAVAEDDAARLRFTPRGQRLDPGLPRARSCGPSRTRSPRCART